ncbi:MAG: 5'/3'-nucleotidase SurE [Anaerolineae bacterium]
MALKPRILITNDDGFFAPGIKHLWQALVDIAEVFIIAPASEQSGVGLSLSLRNPLQIDPLQWDKNTRAWKINGTPADCVRLGVSVILKDKPDLIVSGINRGYNSGRNVLYSGTIGGVIEGVLRGIPGIAFSCGQFDDSNYETAEKYIYTIVQHVLDVPLPHGTFLNVNFPHHPGDIKGFKLARQGKGYWVEDPDHRIHPEGKPYYWLGGKWLAHEEHDESDVALLDQGFMTAVPIHINELTDHALLKARKYAFESLFTPN